MKPFAVIISCSVMVTLVLNCGGPQTLGPAATGNGFGNAVSLNSATGDLVNLTYTAGLNFGTGKDITVEAFVEPAAIGTSQSIFKDSQGFELYISASGALATKVPDGAANCPGSGASVAGPSGGILIAGTKYYVAATFSNASGSIQIFLNGIKIPNVLIFVFSPVCTSVSGVLGSNFTGIIDELRISTSLRYPNTFIPPFIPFSPNLGTMALFHFDGPATVGQADYASLGSTTYTFGGAPSFIKSPFP